MSKPNLPPMPPPDTYVWGCDEPTVYSPEATTAYAEEAVRQALAAVSVESIDTSAGRVEEIEMARHDASASVSEEQPVAYLHTSNRTLTWPGKLNEVQLASGVWRALYEHPTASGHKPAPVDTSPGHNSETVRTLWGLKERYRMRGENALQVATRAMQLIRPRALDEFERKQRKQLVQDFAALHEDSPAGQAGEAVCDAWTAGFLAGLDMALSVLEHDDFATRAQSAQVIRAIKSQHTPVPKPETRDG